MMNCLGYALRFWEKNPEYRLYYNSSHVINLDYYGTGADHYINFLPVEDFGYSYFSSAFEGLLDEYEQDLLKKYFNI
jgi:hypothetical protein